jgi:transcriptional regulator with XRE-family HTH domain
LSEAIGMSRKFLADVEGGDRNISVERLFDIADHFGVPPAVLLENIK